MRAATFLALCLALTPTLATAETRIPPGCDFNGDGGDDLVLSSSGGAATRVWIQLAGPPMPALSGTIASAGWQVVGCGDFNGDGLDDLVYDGANATRIDLMNGTAVAARGWIGNGAGAFHVAAVADVDGSGHSDLIRTDATGGIIKIDVMRGLASFASGWLPHAAGVFAGSGDLDGDGNADIALDTLGPRLCCGEAWLLDGVRAVEGRTFHVRTVFDHGEFAAIADLDASGTASILSDRAGAIYVDHPMWARAIPTSTDDSWRFAAAADVDGDGRSDLILEAPGLSTHLRILVIADTIATEAGPAVREIGHVGTGGGAFDLRQTGDFDGDGKMDLAYQGPCTVRIDRMNGTSVASRTYLATGCDWDLADLP